MTEIRGWFPSRLLRELFDWWLIPTPAHVRSRKLLGLRHLRVHKTLLSRWWLNSNSDAIIGWTKRDQWHELSQIGAFYVFPNVKQIPLSCEALADYLLEQELPCCEHCVWKIGDGYLRISYANSLENIREALKEFRQQLKLKSWQNAIILLRVQIVCTWCQSRSADMQKLLLLNRMLSSTSELLHTARRNAYAIGAFNVYNLEGVRAVVDAALLNSQLCCTKCA